KSWFFNMMQKSVGKREYKTAFAGPASISQKEPPKKLSRQARARINKKRQEEEQSAILPEGRNSAVLIPDIVPPSRSTLFLIQTGY
ncbi:9738_t:CDS:2, partial [Gigaspora rosea]